MPEPGGGGAEAFWDFSLDTYSRPGVEAACLGLQDRRGLQVNLLLFCCWAGCCGHRLGRGEIEGLLDASRDWHAQVVIPLRGLRRWLKGREAVAAGAAGQLRALIKEQELEAERIEQRLLTDSAPLTTGEPEPALAAANLAAYLAAVPVQPTTADRADLAVLIGAAFEDLDPESAAALVDRALSPET